MSNERRLRDPRTFFLGLALFRATAACMGQIEPGGDALSSPTGQPGARASDTRQPGSGAAPQMGAAPVLGEAPQMGAAPVLGEAPQRPSTLGPVALRRLNNVEYENTMIDVLGAKLGVTAMFVPDDPALGYTNQASALQLTPLIAEQYYAAAIRLSDGVDPGALAPCAVNANRGGCSDMFITSLGRRLYRRPITDPERIAYRALFDQKVARTDWPGAVRLVVKTMLQSPYFLYKTEIGSGAGVERTLTNHEIATQISYLVTGHPPDATLSAAADAGTLSQASARLAHVDRLLKTPASVPWLTAFVSQWLGVQGVADVSKDAKLFPAYTAATRTAVQEQANRFISSILTDNAGSIETLFNARWTFANKDLGAYFGASLPSTNWQKVQVPPTQRMGILTQPAFLVATSKGDDSNAIRRGKTLLMRILCGEVPPPPNDVTVDPVVVHNPNVTARERLAQHEKAGSVCAGCHRLMDPLGLSFENYDAVGAWRTMDAGKRIDPSGMIIGVAPEVDGAIAGALDLVNRIAPSDTLKRCAAREVTRWALGRATATAATDTGAARDQQILDLVFAKLKATGDVRSALTALVERDEFLTRSDR